MPKKQQYSHVRDTITVTPPPPKTWTTPAYQLEHFTVRRHVKVVRVELHGLRGKIKRSEAISFPLLPGIADTDLVRAAVWFSPNKWTVPIRMNISQFNGRFSYPIDERLINTLMNPKQAASEPYYQPQPPQTLTLPQAPVSAPQWQFQQQPLPQPGQFQQPFITPSSAGAQKGIRQWYKSRSKRAKIGLWSAFIAFCIFVFAISSALGSSTPSTTPTASPTTQQVAVLSSPAVTQPAQPTVAPTQIPTHIPTTQPTPKPTLVPTHQATPRPTQAPPTPTACPGVNCNPWGYNFSSGKLIYYPPSNFCSYFNCIASFWEPDDPGDGYIMQCSDGTYSQSGGERGACSYHGGVSRPLYSH